jgi:hypothetical protein
MWFSAALTAILLSYLSPRLRSPGAKERIYYYLLQCSGAVRRPTLTAPRLEGGHGPWHSSLLGGVHLSRDDAPLAPPCPWARFPAWSMLRPKRDVAAQLLGAGRTQEYPCRAGSPFGERAWRPGGSGPSVARIGHDGWGMGAGTPARARHVTASCLAPPAGPPRSLPELK